MDLQLVVIELMADRKENYIQSDRINSQTALQKMSLNIYRCNDEPQKSRKTEQYSQALKKHKNTYAWTDELIRWARRFCTRWEPRFINPMDYEVPEEKQLLKGPWASYTNKANLCYVASLF
jgi:hypothetical protein